MLYVCLHLETFIFYLSKLPMDQWNLHLVVFCISSVVTCKMRPYYAKSLWWIQSPVRTQWELWRYKSNPNDFSLNQFATAVVPGRQKRAVKALKWNLIEFVVVAVKGLFTKWACKRIKLDWKRTDNAIQKQSDNCEKTVLEIRAVPLPGPHITHSYMRVNAYMNMHKTTHTHTHRHR